MNKLRFKLAFGILFGRLNKFIVMSMPDQVQSDLINNSKAVDVNMYYLGVDKRAVDKVKRYIESTNPKLSQNQADLVREWDGNSVISIFPGTGAQVQTFQSRAEEQWESEEFRCAMMALDDIGVPRVDDNGERYSIVGRIQHLKNNQDGTI